MTFEEWYFSNRQEIFSMFFDEVFFEDDSMLAQSGVEKLMKMAWDGRYETLTYNDL